MLRILAGNTDATNSLGENSTASAAKEELPGLSMVMVSVIVTVLVFKAGLGDGFGAATTFGLGEHTV